MVERLQQHALIPIQCHFSQCFYFFISALSVPPPTTEDWKLAEKELLEVLNLLPGFLSLSDAVKWFYSLFAMVVKWISTVVKRLLSLPWLCLSEAHWEGRKWQPRNPECCSHCKYTIYQLPHILNLIPWPKEHCNHYKRKDLFFFRAVITSNSY